MNLGCWVVDRIWEGKIKLRGGGGVRGFMIGIRGLGEFVNFKVIWGRGWIKGFVFLWWFKVCK